jgi:peptidoglycan/xylan/chitin deacetylase (PgdA/CDA1 family)
VYQNAYPILQQYGFVATFYIIANTVDAAGSLNTRKLQKLLASGWEIGSHSMTHADLTTDSDWENEIINARLVLEEKLDTEIRTFAYPYGKANDALKTYTLNAGYSAAVGLGSIMEHNHNTLFFLHRKEIKSWYELDFFEEFALDRLKKRLSNKEEPLQILNGIYLANSTARVSRITVTFI